MIECWNNTYRSTDNGEEVTAEQAIFETITELNAYLFDCIQQYVEEFGNEVSFRIHTDRDVIRIEIIHNTANRSYIYVENPVKVLADMLSMIFAKASLLDEIK